MGQYTLPGRIETANRHIVRLFQEEIDKGELAGACAAVSYKGERLAEVFWGQADMEKRLPIERNTIFRLYSASKPIAAVAAMLLWERGLIDFAAPLAWYLPEFQDMTVLTEHGIEKAKKQITILDLMRMTSGIVYPDDDEAGSLMKEVFEEQRKSGFRLNLRQMCALAAKKPLAFEPGERWRYGFSVDVLGAVLETVTGKSLREFYMEEIFKPLGMKDTDFYVPEEKQDRFAQLYSKWDGDKELKIEKERTLGLTECLEKPCFESAGAGLVSTMEDYLKFADMLAAGGKFSQGTFLGRKTMEILGRNQLTPKQAETVYFDQMKGCGYGNFMRVYENPMEALCSGTVGEFGWDGWTGPYMTVNPAEGFSIVVMMQRCGYVNMPLIRKLRNIAYSLI